MKVGASTGFAVIFDMDGVLIDSVKLNWQAINEVLAAYKITIEDNQVKSYLGRTLKDQVSQFNSDFGLHLSYDDFNQATEKIKNRLCDSLKPKDGVQSLLSRLQERRVPMAVATSMPRDLTEQRLSKTGLLSYFQVLVTEDEIRQHKPDPEVYLKAASLLSVDPSRCVVFEDAPSGVQSAKAAGMKCIAVRTPYVPLESLKAADASVDSLSHIALSKISSLALTDLSQSAENA